MSETVVGCVWCGQDFPSRESWLEHRGDDGCRYGDGYDVGDVVRNSWGYDQTNYDFYRIVRRTAQTVTLHELEQRSTGEAGFMAEYVEPTDRLRSDREPFRRKLRRDRETGEIRGLQVNSYGWATSWDGRRSRATHYA